MIYKENRFCPDKGQYVDFIALKNLCRVLKNHKLFFNFRCTIGSTTRSFMGLGYRCPMVIKSNAFASQHDSNPFKACKTLKNVLDVIAAHNHCPLHIDNDASIQNRIVGTINLLMHVLLERSIGQNIPLLEQIGEETFKAACDELFGTNFKDLTVPEGVDMDVVRKINDALRRGERPELSPEEKQQLDKFMQYVNQHRNPDTPVQLDDEGFFEDEDWDEMEDAEDIDNDWE
jgi:hypothetical protein